MGKEKGGMREGEWKMKTGCLEKKQCRENRVFELDGKGMGMVWERMGRYRKGMIADMEGMWQGERKRMSVERGKYIALRYDTKADIL